MLRNRATATEFFSAKLGCSLRFAPGASGERFGTFRSEFLPTGQNGRFGDRVAVQRSRRSPCEALSQGEHVHIAGQMTY